MGVFTATRYVRTIDMVEVSWLKELGIRYVRLSAGWGQEGQGLYNNKQVSVNGDFIEYYCQIYSPRETGCTISLQK